MCKIMVMAGIKDECRPQALEFMRKMGDKMSFHPNNDGLGYAAVDIDGNLYGERWHTNHQAFKYRDPITEFDKLVFKKTKGMLRKKRNAYNTFGTINEDKMAAVILHTRYATSGKEFCNTHPFVDGDTALIHNGVIKNTKELDNFTSTCDSECILNKYVEMEVSDKPKSIQKVADALEGYYACGVISKTSKGQAVVDVFKDSGSRLDAAFIKEFGVMVFSTDFDDIEKVCKDMNLTIEASYICVPGVMVRMDALTGDAIDAVEFTPEYASSKKKNQSLTVVPKTGGTREVAGLKQDDEHRCSSVDGEDFRELCKGLENMSDWKRNPKTNVWYKTK